MYEWYLSILDDDDQETFRFLRKTGKEHMARKPTSRVSSIVPVDGRLDPRQRFQEFHDYMFTGGSRSKWERIGKPLFTPSIEMAMYFTPMNPIVYRLIRVGLTAHDIHEGVYDYE